MSIYRVDKSEQPVVLFQADGSVMKGVVFLSACAYSHIGQQTLADLLREKGDFFAFRSDSGAFCVANKATITHIRCDQFTVEPLHAPLGNPVEVQVNFAGGEQLRGTVIIEMPEGRNRLFDFVNSMRGFFSMQTGEAHYLVNVDQIRDISPC
jgi:hypothetical protein